MQYVEPVPETDLISPRPCRFRHRLIDSGLFDDDALAKLLDGYPEDEFNASTMDRSSANGWRYGEVRGLRGAEILDAVRTGHLWLNIKNVHRHSAQFAELTDRLYEELASASGCCSPDWRAATLLVSSPRASVGYHADAVPNVLWHVRGRKRLLVYPTTEDFLPRRYLEEICAGERDEDLPYERDFDLAALAIDLDPGWAAMWPQNAPHRVENVAGLNVSLSTEHVTPDVRRRVNVMRANGLLRRCLGREARSTASTGVVATAKHALMLTKRGVDKIRRKPDFVYEFPITFRVDPRSPDGFVDVS